MNVEIAEQGWQARLVEFQGRALEGKGHAFSGALLVVAVPESRCLSEGGHIGKVEADEAVFAPRGESKEFFFVSYFRSQKGCSATNAFAQIGE